MRQVNHATTGWRFKKDFCHVPKDGEKLNLGCGADYIEGFVNLDGNTKIKADIYHELDRKHLHLPFVDGQFDYIFASHILEHIINLIPLKKELARILKIGGGMTVVVPHYLSPDAWGDDTHIRAFSPHSFMELYWDKFKINELVMTEHSPGNDANAQKIYWLVANLIRITDEEKNSIIEKIQQSAEVLLHGGN